MKVISNTFLFVYSSSAPSSKLHAGITRDGAIISIETPHHITGKGLKVSSCVVLRQSYQT